LELRTENLELGRENPQDALRQARRN